MVSYKIAIFKTKLEYNNYIVYYNVKYKYNMKWDVGWYYGKKYQEILASNTNHT